MGPGDYRVEERMLDGGTVVVRSIRPDDRERLLEGFRRLTRRSVYLRFLGFKKTLSPKELTYFTEVDFVHHVGLVAVLDEGGGEKIVGSCRYIEIEGEPRKCAELALAVVDEHHGRGIGTILLRHVTSIARRSGVEEFRAEMSPENSRMLEVFSNSGYGISRRSDFGVLHVTLTFPDPEGAPEPDGQ